MERCPISCGDDTQVVVKLHPGKHARTQAEVTVSPSLAVFVVQFFLQVGQSGRCAVAKSTRQRTWQRSCVPLPRIVCAFAMAVSISNLQVLIEASVKAAVAGQKSAAAGRPDERHFRRMDKFDGKNWKSFLSSARQRWAQ